MSCFSGSSGKCPPPGVEIFVAGAMSWGYSIAGLRTRDTLFAVFAVAF
jgi:hypothetical protein